MTETAIAAHNLNKRYRGAKEGVGLNGFELTVKAGQVCGLLGPNGAGKTTAIKILTTLLDFEAGQAQVAGFDVKTQARQVRQNIGLVGQYAAIDEILSGRHNLQMFGQLYHLSHRQAARRADELLQQFGLADTGATPVSKFSGGMRRRLDLAASLIIAPPVLFVDEPTTGLDPLGRREVWNALRSLVTGGTTLLLTTQYLEEADQLADHIALLKAGRIIAEGTPDQLKARLSNDWLDVVIESGSSIEQVAALLQPLAAGEVRFEAEANKVSVPVAERTRALIAAVGILADAQIVPQDIGLRRPTLDEVFITLTGSAQTENAVEVAR